MEIRKAVRKKAKLRLGLVAASGAGKTYSALQLAFGLGGKVGMVDTEHGSGDLYAHLGDYDIINIEAPYTVQKYREAMAAFESAGYSVIVIDSLSHAWAGDGGLLDKQGKIADSGRGNSYTAWRSITPEHNGLIDAMLQSPCHVIATMRAKVEYVIEKNDKGKDTPRKVGMAPVQREGMDYEFTVVLDIDAQHIASASKDRTGLFDGQYFKITQATGKTLTDWLESGADGATLILQELTAATEVGTDALIAAYGRLKTQPGFKAVWASEGDALKAAAALNDEPQKEAA
ncbi:ATP-binding protein [Methylibium sp.]|uniref:ATP-binding protein n=1 Tax=Methylibium sp. TaxID=2067992 RepID=UPI0017BA57B2|nr:ATP-binding protein [Methylibium sp.]MBA3589683.1 AAA family ATPase [Methylibium sp.]